MSLDDSDSSQPVPPAPEPLSHNLDDGPRPCADAELGEPSPESSSSSSETESPNMAKKHLQRPKMASRKSSGTIIVSRDGPIELEEEEYEAGDARTMSPRRTSEEVDKLEHSARQALIQQAKSLQESLLQIVDRVESVKTEHEKLEGGNKFLQSYIGELMQTSKLTAGTGKGRARGRSSK